MLGRDLLVIFGQEELQLDYELKISLGCDWIDFRRFLESCLCSSPRREEKRGLIPRTAAGN